jgi:hemerythrin
MDQQAFTQWRPAFSVGNSVLDNQHKKLLRLCQQAIECMADDSREGLEQFHDILNELAEYVDQHFRAEEALLKACAYPLLERHKEEHLQYQLRLTDFLLSATLGEINKAGLHHYLSAWWSEHILGSDKQYSGFIQGANQ